MKLPFYYPAVLLALLVPSSVPSTTIGSGLTADPSDVAAVLRSSRKKILVWRRYSPTRTATPFSPPSARGGWS